MVKPWQERTKMLIGEDGISNLQKSHVIIFGVGGVGGYVAEGLARAGIGNFTLVDKDVISESNINRQIIALTSTVGMSKTRAMKERILLINPLANVIVKDQFFLPENSDEYDFSQYSYVVDAVDTVTAKLEIIMKAKKVNVPVISAMGAGNKFDPSKFKIADVFDTKVCPLARVMRHECKKRGIEKLKVAYSEEEPVKTLVKDEETGKAVPGSMIFAPASCGLLMASEIIKDLRFS